MSEAYSVRRAVDWGELAPLRLRARAVAEGVYAGAHRSARRGAGVEFGGYREYVPGDDLRWLDRRSLLRHERLVVRQFETETDRALCLVVDASGSMAFRGPGAPASKLAFAGVVAAALARVALGGGDPVALAFAGASGRDAPLGRSGGREQFEKVVAALEAVDPGGDAPARPVMLDRALQFVARSTRRGAIVVVLSDLIDLPDHALERVREVSSEGRVLTVVQVLDPAEAHFPFTGTVRLRSLEGRQVIETDAEQVRERYLTAMTALAERWQRALTERGARFVRATSADDPVRVVRQIVESVR